MRDLASADPWQESLERSLARRGKRPAPAQDRLRQARQRAVQRPASRPHRGRARPPAQRSRLMKFGTGTVAAAVALVVITGSLFDGPGARASGGHASAAVHRVVIGRRTAFERDLVSAGGGCQPAPPSSGYVNPLAQAVVRGERIDQGVDYAGQGSLVAIGRARVTYVGTSGTGWPGAFIEYRLLGGPDRGCFVYYAEGIQPGPTLHVGQIIGPGQQLATIIPGWPTGIELGWGAGSSTKSYAANTHGWTAEDDAGNVASDAGKSFSMLIVDLGGPAGRVEG